MARCLRIQLHWLGLLQICGFNPQPSSGVKDPVLLQLWCRSGLWLQFSTWPGNLHMPQEQP